MAEGFALNFAVFCAVPALLSSCFLLTGLPSSTWQVAQIALPRHVKFAKRSTRNERFPTTRTRRPLAWPLCDMVDLQREVASAYVVPWHKWRC